MQLKYKETLGRGREREERACSPRVPATREGQGGVEVRVGARARGGWRRRGRGRGGVLGGVEVGGGGGVESGVGAA